MAEILGIGMSHAPHLQFTDKNMEVDRQRFAELKTVQLRQWGVISILIRCAPQANTKC